MRTRTWTLVPWGAAWLALWCALCLALPIGGASARAATQPAARPADGRQETHLYRAGRIAPGWQDYSWAPHALSVPAPDGLHGQVMSVIFKAFSGLYLHAAGLYEARDSVVLVTINGGAVGGQHLSLMLVDSRGAFGRPIPLDLYLPYGILPRRRWITLRAPMAQSLPDGALLHGVVLQEAVGQNAPLMYVAAVTLRARPSTPLRPRRIPRG